jgi:hypothetical protein
LCSRKTDVKCAYIRFLMYYYISNNIYESILVKSFHWVWLKQGGSILLQIFGRIETKEIYNRETNSYQIPLPFNELK